MGRRPLARTRMAIPVLCAVAVVRSAAGDVVVLRSGTVLEGTAKSFDGERLTLAVEAGTTVLERAAIAAVHFGITKQQYEAGEATRSPDRTPAPSASPPDGQVAWGGHVRTATFTLAVVRARIATTQIRDMMGDAKVGTTPDLQITLSVRNVAERKVLRFREPNPFLANPFLLHDDVGNQIRGVNYGFGSEVVGALTGKEDVLPDQTATHLLLFQIPPPKTKQLTLTMDLSVFGEEGSRTFVIPISVIDGFRPR